MDLSRALLSGQDFDCSTAPLCEDRARAMPRWLSSCTFLALPVLLVVLTVGDIVLGAILFDRFTEVYAQYLNQATALVYCIASSSFLFYRWLAQRPSQQFNNRVATADIGHACVADGEEGSCHRGAPWSLLVVVGILNGSSNFLLAIAQPHTPGLTQSLLSLLGVPFVMALSFLFLHRRPSAWALVGAGLIVVGTVISGLRAVLNGSSGDGGISALWYSVVLFACGQVKPNARTGSRVLLYINVFSLAVQPFSSRVLMPFHNLSWTSGGFNCNSWQNF
ncbi:hypothetical protein CYMTET_33635 [Cymbomonas tetramitiformis]|uniref:Uncharacterized protein n=1 Tax=Cymbomonas tetramitiformis TaxID=36881 RepID=A0AAE0FDA8_9CHLO|nr:hypothetical protein CYMTET_33635 [Cymbomonas tetramitiformis]